VTSIDPTPVEPAEDESTLIAARREKLRRFREELGLNPYGQRVDGLMPLAEARCRFREEAHAAYESAKQAAKSGGGAIVDERAPVLVAGRIVQHRDIGKLVFIRLRDHTGDLQVTVSKANVDEPSFQLAKKLDYGDVIVAGGRIGRTNTNEVCVWADRVELHCKSLAPPPEKWHGLTDPELRYRQRYVDMYANPRTIEVLQERSRLVTRVRRFMDGRGYLEVETPMMQPMAGGAAARPFTTHHNALDMKLFLRIAPELYLKRLLVGGLPKVYEINRNFRNEGIDRSHNPEFTMMEVYEAFGDCWTMLDLTESLVHELARAVAGADNVGPVLPYGDLRIDYARPFRRSSYGELFEKQLGFSMWDEAKTLARAREAHVENAEKKDHWLLVSELFDRFGEHGIDPLKPTFVTDFPSAISPLTRPQPDRPELSYRWELFIAGMEVANSYTELNDPDVQLQRFTEQLRGLDEEAAHFRTLDDDFINALRVGMPPAGGLGVGIDRLVMLMTDSPTIRDVICFPLMRPQ
jgi:lysyl-tRNA synthetase, class II